VKEWKIPAGDWTTALYDALEEADEGDIIIVHNKEMQELAERAARRMAANVTFRIEAPQE
jgi:hypothetical protein